MPENVDIARLKADLRRLAMKSRGDAKAINPGAPLVLTAQFLAKIPLPPRSLIAFYRARDDEMDVGPLTEALRERGYPIALATMAGRSQPLQFRLYDKTQPLIRNQFDIEEPPPNAPLIDPDILLVPLLAFDRKRQRLGMGGGYFDRTLEALRAKKNICAVGAGYAAQEVTSVPVMPHDAPLDRIVTEIEVF